MKPVIALSCAAFLTTSLYANSDLESKFAAMMEKMEQQQKKIEELTLQVQELKSENISVVPSNDKEIETLKKQVAKIEKKQKRQGKTLSKVKAHDANDNIKFDVEFRNTYEMLEYKNNTTGETAENDSLLTSRLYLNMGAAPMDGLIFKGKLGIYSTWGAHIYHDDDAAFKSWAGSSKASDTVMRIKEAYFVYSDEIGEQPYSISIGRRPASTGFLANYRENESISGSPLAHITNMEVDAAMLKLDWGEYMDGAYSKFVYGRAHSGEMEGVYGDNSAARFPYATTNDLASNGEELEDDNVDFFVLLGDAYNNGQYQLMYQWAHIFNTKGKALNGIGTADDVVKAASGTADMYALSFKIDGIGEEISDFLDNTTLFTSVAYTNYNAKDGYSLLGSNDGGSKDGHSLWLGVIMPDMITEDGKLGIEYNYGSQYWTPMTWAEDTAIGSKIAVRGSAYEAYWNFNLFGVKYLPSQIRYTYINHDYTPNVNCAGWVAPIDVDITSQNLRFAVTYKY
jgi:polyhydroxyalkanoate synthesis regulator phasin